MGISGLSQLPASDNDTPEPREGNHQGKNRSFCAALCFVMFMYRHYNAKLIRDRMLTAHTRFSLGNKTIPFRINSKWAAPLDVVAQRFNHLLSHVITPRISATKWEVKVERFA